MNDDNVEQDNVTNSHRTSDPLDGMTELQPLMESCASLIRRGLQYRPRLASKWNPESTESQTAQLPWFFEGDGSSNEHIQLQQEWLSEMTRIQHESLFLQRLRSSLLQREALGDATSTQILRAHGRTKRDTQIAEVLHLQSILEEYTKKIAAVEAQIRQVQATNQRLFRRTPDSTTARAETVRENISAADERTIRENRLLQGVILDLLPLVIDATDGVAASRLQRYFEAT